MKKLLSLIILILMLTLPSTVLAVFSDYDDFEYDLGAYTNETCVGYDGFYLHSNWARFEDCHQEIAQTISDRSSSAGTGKYFHSYCNWETDTSSDRLDAQRSSTIYANDTNYTVDCNAMSINDGTEYWIGWSFYIPADYYQEYCSHSIVQFTRSPTGPNTILANLEFGGGYGSGTCSDVDRDYFRYRAWHSGSTTNAGTSMKWTDLQGTWVDLVFHFVWYTSVNADAISEMYINGSQIYSYSGEINHDLVSDGVGLNTPFLYNALSTADPLSTWNRWYVENGDTQKAPWREVSFDEFRITGDTIDTKEYCDVAPPIWPAKPTNITPNGMDITLTPTASWAAYDDFRSDLQGCFSAYQMKVQVDESGGDWAGLVYDSGTIGYAASEQISGLAWDTDYQIRVAHSSYNTDRSEEYWSEWSDTVYFTTGPTSEPPAVPSAFHIGVCAESGLNAVYDDQGLTVGE